MIFHGAFLVFSFYIVYPSKMQRQILFDVVIEFMFVIVRFFRHERSELDYLIYNDPIGYVDHILNGNPETYLKTITEYKPLD